MAYEMIELVGTSTEGVSCAINNALEAAKTGGSTIYWFEVEEIRGAITKEKKIEYQVKVKCGCK